MEEKQNLNGAGVTPFMRFYDLDGYEMIQNLVERDIHSLLSENDALKSENKTLEIENQKLLEVVAALQKAVVKLQDEIFTNAIETKRKP